MSDIRLDLLTEGAIRACVARSADIIREYDLEPSQALGEALAHMFQAGILFAHDTIKEEL
jgi:hypothetical protein